MGIASQLVDLLVGRGGEGEGSVWGRLVGWGGEVEAAHCCLELPRWSCVAGEIVEVLVHHRCRNWMAYRVRDTDQIRVNISGLGDIRGEALEALIEVCEEDESVRLLKFSPRKAGAYRISVTIDGKHVRSSPFYPLIVSPGEVDPRQCVIANVVNEWVVGLEDTYCLLPLHMRDRFGNEVDVKCDQFSICLVMKNCAGVEVVVKDPLVEKDTHGYQLYYFILEKAGVYRGVLRICGTVIQNGKFNNLVLSEKENAVVKEKLKTQGTNFKVKLVDQKDESESAVYCHISSKQFIVKDYIIGLIPRRICSFRLSTKLNFQLSEEDKEKFHLDDEKQNAIVLKSAERNILFAIFCHNLMVQRKANTFENKQAELFAKVRGKSSSYRSVKGVKIQRECIVKSAYSSLKSLSYSGWRDEWQVKFENEMGIGVGLTSEFFSLLTHDLFKAENSAIESNKSLLSQSLFVHLDRTNSLVHPNALLAQDKLSNKLFYFAGRIMGKCLYESSHGPKYTQTVKARLSRSFYRMLLGLRVDKGCLETDDPELYKGKIEFLLNNPVKDLELTFTDEIYDPKGNLVEVKDLVPRGSRITVTEDNKVEYCNLLAVQRLVLSVQPLMDNFKSGFFEFVTEDDLADMDESELELLLCGVANISVDEFKENVEYRESKCKGFAKSVSWFWVCVENMTQEERGRLLQFITGSSQLPPGGFFELYPKIVICPSFQTSKCPTSATW
eukprot:Nk52_evm35s164 gene=Nk52_evmTU35s164